MRCPHIDRTRSSYTHMDRARSSMVDLLRSAHRVLQRHPALGGLLDQMPLLVLQRDGLLLHISSSISCLTCLSEPLSSKLRADCGGPSLRWSLSG
jgi:hypothetical protein